jgi:hypothetical protein
MKKMFFVFVIFFTINFICVADKKDIDGFIKEADKILRETEKVKKELNNERVKYENRTGKIEILKDKKNSFIAENLINNLLLKYHLGRANNSAYKIYKLTKKQRELNNDYFTIVSLIMTEYGEKIKTCIISKCPDLQYLYNERTKWVDIIKNYEGYIGVDLVFDIFEKKYDEKSRKDLIDYLNVKIIQIEQRIYLLNEEILINDMLKNSKAVSVKDERKEFDEKIKELQKLKYVIRDKIKEIEENNR